MDRARSHQQPQASGEVVDFDEAMLDACPPATRAELMAEAYLVASAFAPAGEPEALDQLAALLSSHDTDLQAGRAHARRLAAALKRLRRCW